MKYKLDFDLFIEQAITDAFTRYTLSGYNTSHVANLAAEDLIKDWGPELAAVFEPAIKAEMSRQLDGIMMQREVMRSVDE